MFEIYDGFKNRTVFFSVCFFVVAILQFCGTRECEGWVDAFLLISGCDKIIHHISFSTHLDEENVKVFCLLRLFLFLLFIKEIIKKILVCVYVCALLGSLVLIIY
uniref:Uncharacterized protein n=1 Tax=Cacopsylla melanoneura TaxID=428564 RepID=A0A8D8RFW3_9HEMI